MARAGIPVWAAAGLSPATPCAGRAAFLLPPGRSLLEKSGVSSPSAYPPLLVTTGLLWRRLCWRLWFFGKHHGRRFMDRLTDTQIGAATTEVTIHRRIDFRVRGLGIDGEQPCRR